MWLQRGLFGLDFKKQTLWISVLYCISCFITIIYGLVLIGNPGSFVRKDFNEPSAATPINDDNFTTPLMNFTTLGNSSESEGNLTLANITSNGDEFEVQKDEELSVAEDAITAKKIEDGEISSEERQHYSKILSNIQTNGTELAVASLVTFCLSLLLIQGSKQEKSIMFVPWLTEQVTGLIVVAVVGMTKLIRGDLRIAPGFVLLYLFMYLVVLMTVYAVMSHFIFLRKLKAHSANIISSVMQGPGYQTGVNYDILREELGHGRELQEIGPAAVRTSPGPKQKDDLMYFSI